MIVDCPSCGTGFRLDESALGEAGRRLRCSVCGHVWFQPSPEAAAKGTDANEGGAHCDDEEHRGEAPPETPAPAAPAAPATPIAPPAPARQGSGGWGFMLFLLLVIGGIALAVLLSRVLPPFWV